MSEFKLEIIDSKFIPTERCFVSPVGKQYIEALILRVAELEDKKPKKEKK